MQKHTVKLILRTNKPNKHKLYPVYLRITIDRRSSYLSTGTYISKGDWDDKWERVKDTHPLSSELNRDLLTRKREVLDAIHLNAQKAKTTTAREVKELSTHRVNHTNIFDFTDAYVKEMTHKRKAGTLDNWGKHLSKLEGYRGHRSLSFEEITVDYLNDFEEWLRDGGINSRGDDSSAYIHAIMRSIRGIFNVARNVKKVITCYPFGPSGYELPRNNYKEKDKLTLEELDTLGRYADTVANPRHRLIAAWFLFGCYTGLRVSDWLQFDFKRHAHKGYISLRATKTGGTASIPVHARLKVAMSRCKELPLKEGLPPRQKQAINDTLKEIAKGAGIDKHLSTHCARKTFAVTMCAEMGVSLETCAHLMAITVETCYKSYYRVTAAKVKDETAKAWAGL